jgi:hypothetical protein
MIDHCSLAGNEPCATYGTPDDYQNSGSISFRRLDYFGGSAAARNRQLTSTPLFPIRSIRCAWYGIRLA